LEEFFFSNGKSFAFKKLRASEAGAEKAIVQPAKSRIGPARTIGGTQDPQARQKLFQLSRGPHAMNASLAVAH
jgi:hypothetical protein